MKKRSLATVLAVFVFFLIVPPFSAAAADLPVEKYNQIVYDYAYSIHKQYGIDIRYPIRGDGYAGVGTRTLETLDKTLSYITPSVISQLSQYYYNTRGSFLTFRFTYLPEDLQQKDIGALARFIEDESLIELFIPHPNTPMTLTGCSPIAIAHEIGHAFYIFFTEMHGDTAFRRSWLGFNNYEPYDAVKPHDYNRSQYISHYATINAEEDFSETFAYAFVCNRPGLGFSDYLYAPGYTFSPLGQKVNYLKTILPLYLTNTSQAVANISTTQRTASSIDYQGTKLSGNSLEYIGFHEPYGIYSTIVESLKIEEQYAFWVYEVGGWRVTDVHGGVYLLFPGSTFVTLRIAKPMGK